jgi:hypothetical protein
MYNVFTQLVDGYILFIASRDDLDEAIQLIADLNATWPRKYIVRDSEGRDVDIREFAHAQQDFAQIHSLLRPSSADCS